MFNEKDLKQIQSKGIDLQTIDFQIENFKQGFPYINLVSPATRQNGIIFFNEKETKELSDFYTENAKNKNILKFVPASGAASRMFKHLFEFRDNYKGTDEDYKKFLEDKSFNSVYNFFDKIKNFAFYDDLKAVMLKHGLNIEQCIKSKDFVTVIDFLLSEKGLNYAKLPKGLLKFHNYPDGSRMSVEEHLVEGAVYCKDKNNNVAIHFTVSPEHKKEFSKEVNRVKGKYEKYFNVKFNIDFSIQKSSTDTIAVDMDNKPFREQDQSLLFRPGGHGALIENLNDLEGEIIFVKNIDNIVPDKLREPTYLYKKVIAGYLLKLRKKTFEYLEMLEKGNLNNSQLDEIENFAENKLEIRIEDNFKNLTKHEKTKYLFDKLNRPMRICGMVKNEGEPGGGPFLIRNSKSENSLQIVESSQIDLKNPEQNNIIQQATHFNPVDLVCSVKDYKGEPFDLKKYVDPSTGFISVKSKNGKNLKAQELPGLWNGAMADWITVFVETPIITFNPVKTVNDLLRKQHQ